MDTVHNILQRKGSTVYSIPPDASVYEALQKMAEMNVGALLVLDAGRLAGIFSERDYARKVVLKGKFSRDTPVRDVMTSEVITVGREQSIEWCMALMTEKRLRHLPVVDAGRLTGMISIGDVVKSIISEQQYTINQLEEYILGRR
jgi:CBS domain-containing protein